MCTYLTYLHGSHLTPNLGNSSPSLPRPRGLQREQAAAAGTQAEGAQGTAYFYSCFKKYLQLFQVSFVCGQAGRAPRGAAGARRGLRAQRAGAPSRRGVGGSADPSGVAGNRAGARVKRNENEHSKFFC